MNKKKETTSQPSIPAYFSQFLAEDHRPFKSEMREFKAEMGEFQNDMSEFQLLVADQFEKVFVRLDKIEGDTVEIKAILENIQNTIAEQTKFMRLQSEYMNKVLKAQEAKNDMYEHRLDRLEEASV